MLVEADKLKTRAMTAKILEKSANLPSFLPYLSTTDQANFHLLGKVNSKSQPAKPRQTKWNLMNHILRLFCRNGHFATAYEGLQALVVDFIWSFYWSAWSQNVIQLYRAGGNDLHLSSKGSKEMMANGLIFPNFSLSWLLFWVCQLQLASVGSESSTGTMIYRAETSTNIWK